MDNTIAEEAESRPRKRLGRPPKGSTPTTETAEENAFTDDLEASLSVVGVCGVGTSPPQCRRSTRKKFIKFDVLDVLNKGRSKMHKIQIEARIDSNVPATSTKQLAGATTSNVNRLIVTRPSVPLPLPPFVKPQPTPSLIIAQVNSDKTLQPLRKRGRPRKMQYTDTTASVELDVDAYSCNSTSNSSDSLESKDKAKTAVSWESTDSDESLKGFPASDQAEKQPSKLNHVQQQETELITVLSSADEDSNSRIIFVDVKTKATETAVDPATVESEISSIPAEQEQHSFKLIFTTAEQKELEAETDADPIAQHPVAADKQQIKLEVESNNDEVQKVVEQQQLEQETQCKLITEILMDEDEYKKEEKASDTEAPEAEIEVEITEEIVTEVNLNDDFGLELETTIFLEGEKEEVEAEKEEIEAEKEEIEAEKKEVKVEKEEGEAEKEEVKAEKKEVEAEKEEVEAEKEEIEAEKKEVEAEKEVEMKVLILPDSIAQQAGIIAEIVEVKVDTHSDLKLESPKPVELECAAKQPLKDTLVSDKNTSSESKDSNKPIATVTKSETSEKNEESPARKEASKDAAIFEKTTEVELMLCKDNNKLKSKPEVPLTESLERKEESPIIKEMLPLAEASSSKQPWADVPVTLKDLFLKLENPTAIEKKEDLLLKTEKLSPKAEPPVGTTSSTKSSISDLAEAAAVLSCQLQQLEAIKNEVDSLVNLQAEKPEAFKKDDSSVKKEKFPLIAEPAVSIASPLLIIKASATQVTSKQKTTEDGTVETTIKCPITKVDAAEPEKKKQSTAIPRQDKSTPVASSSANVSFVECDALFKVLDKANAQIRYEEKAKKKLKQSAKKQTTKQERQPSPKSSKKQKPNSSRRNTYSEDRSELRDFVQPFKATQNSHRVPESEPKHGQKANQKKPRKGGTAKHLNNNQDSLDSAKFKEKESRSNPSTPTSEHEATNPLLDIAKFIEDGVKLLERDYKPEDEQQQNLTEDELAKRVANMETPATTPSPSPATSTEDLSSGVRRSHRIKQKPQGTRASRSSSTSSSHTPAISMEQQLSELAHIETINEQFLRSEGLNNFQTLRDNYYRCARQVSKENAEMQCDCFVTGDEEGGGQIRCGDSCINRMLMIECGPLCTYAERCTNKRFQQHQGWPCRVFRTEKKGCGITAELEIPPGEFIMEYVGEVIDSEEFERRQHLYSEDRNRHYYFMALRGEAIIDATSKGNISRYINHSCDPNAETQKWTVNGELRIGFFSVKSILPGEEITFDYQYQRYGRDAQRCYCESANCRGWIGNEPETDEGEQVDTESDSEQESLNEDSQRLEQENKIKIPKGGKLKTHSKLTTTRKKRKEQPKEKDREYKAGRWLRPSGGEKSAFNKHDHVEDQDVLEQLTLLSRSGLKNQLDTLCFSRCMVRAKLLESRLQLLGVLTRGELPCRRLFLDYHGLRLLHAWISESGSDNQLRLALLEALESLPIPNRTMLNDSRIYQSVQLWSNQLEPSDEAAKEPESDSVRPRILALLQKWNGLPEIFRIPKRERIEQMKEHEREADLQQQQQHVAATALEDSNSASSLLTTDRYKQDRFRRDTTSRYEKPKPPARMSGNNTICSISTLTKEWPGSIDGSKSDSRRRSDFDPRRTISKELRRSLFERKVAQDEAEKRVGSEDWREHEVRCQFFAADLNTDPKLLPFSQNSETKEWFNSEGAPVPAPLRYGDMNEPPSPEIVDEVEYKLPPGVEPLPSSWHWSMTPEGDIYYYNLRDRIPQWEPPNAEQRLEQLVEDSPVEESEPDEALNATELVNIDIDCGGSLSAKSLAQYIEVKIRERRELRRSRLCSIRVISPRREEDRAYNQQESRKYKENKEKIRRRKEIYRRTRSEQPAEEPAGDFSDSLLIHRYLYSSDEESGADLSLLDREAIETDLLPSVKRKLPQIDVQKKHRSDRDKKRKTVVITREANEKFHHEISGHVAEFLRPYRQDTCLLGRITSEEDYKFLIKRLSHHITTKEMRYCEVSGNPLACTESVKHKSYDFIKQYMRKKGPVYKKPVDNRLI